MLNPATFTGSLAGAESEATVADYNEKTKSQLLTMVRVSVHNALAAGHAAQVIASAVAGELGDTSAAKVRVANALRREGYMEAARELWDDGQHISALTLTEDEVDAIQAPRESDS